MMTWQGSPWCCTRLTVHVYNIETRSLRIWLDVDFGGEKKHFKGSTIISNKRTHKTRYVFFFSRSLFKFVERCFFYTLALLTSIVVSRKRCVCVFLYARARECVCEYVHVSISPWQRTVIFIIRPNESDLYIRTAWGRTVPSGLRSN